MSKLWQELDKLMVFVAVAEKGKITEAAAGLHLTQPSVTRSIQKLEEAFGTPLFSRGREGVRLTKAGALLLEKSTRMLRELADVQQRAQHIDHELAGVLTVGTYESLAEYLWPDFLMRLQKDHPHLQLSVRTAQNQDLVLELLAGKMDLVVDAEPQVKNQLSSWPLYSDKFAFYISPRLQKEEYDHQWAQNMTVLFVQKAWDADHLSIEDHLERAGYRFARQCCFESFSVAKRLALKGMGVAVLPMRLAAEDQDRQLLKPISLKGFSPAGFGKHTIYATVAHGNEKDIRIKNVITLLKTHLK